MPIAVVQSSTSESGLQLLVQIRLKLSENWVCHILQIGRRRFVARTPTDGFRWYKKTGKPRSHPFGFL